MIIGLIRERKQPADARVALTPAQAVELMETIPAFRVVAERSPERVFDDEAYRSMGIELVETANNADILMGIKEVPAEHLIPGKTYLFFSHTIKKQPHNRDMFRAMAAKRITLIDYECLTWPGGGRILGFGRWAGIVGAYNGFLTWGRKTGTFDLKPAHHCRDFSDLLEQLRQIQLPPVKIALTGEGRVGGGAREVLEQIGIKNVAPDELEVTYGEPVYAVFTNQDLYRRKDNMPWDRHHFYKNHTEYISTFNPYLRHIDLLINGLYWESDMPPLFTKEDSRAKDFKIKVIADISCDVEGSVPITIKATTIGNPVFGWDVVRQEATAPYLPGTIDVMAVPNLPTELPASSSEEFGSDLLQHVLPLFLEDPEDILTNATLLDQGRLTEKFKYLEDYLEGNLAD